LAINKGELAAMVIGVVVGFFMAVAFMGGGPVGGDVIFARIQFFLYVEIVLLLFVGGGLVFHFYDSETDTGEEREPKIQEDSLP
jgi:hypothetical protein